MVFEPGVKKEFIDILINCITKMDNTLDGIQNIGVIGSILSIGIAFVCPLAWIPAILVSSFLN
jgi:hypothetical protein